jgi:hypothetical protein
MVNGEQHRLTCQGTSRSLVIGWVIILGAGDLDVRSAALARHGVWDWDFALGVTELPG